MEIQSHVRDKFADKQLGWCPTQEDLDVAIVEIMNRHFAYIQSENSVLQRSFDLVTRKTVWRTTPKNLFLTSYPNLRWQTTIDRSKAVDREGGSNSSKQKVTKHIPKVWIEHAACRSYHSVVFAPYPMGHPYAPRHNMLNLHTGWAWSYEEIREVYMNAGPPVLNRAELFQRHIYDILCNQDKEKFQYLMAFIACKIRRPWFRPDACLIFTGNEGNGKSCVFDRLIRFAGQCGTKCTNIEQMMGSFNHEYKNKLLIFLDEASWQGNIKFNSMLKNFITSDVSTSEQKYRDREVTVNYAALIMCSNDPIVIKQGENARRYAFFPCKLKSYRQDARSHVNYFNRVLGGVDYNDSEGLKVWLHQFYDERLYPDCFLDAFGRFGVNNFPTACLREMEKQKPFSHNVVTKFWQRALERGYSYPPVKDYLLNSSISDNFERDGAHEDVQIFDEGRRFEDLCLDDPILSDCRSLQQAMERVRNPTWRAESMWLGTVNMEQVYEEFMEMKRHDLVPSKGMDSRIDFQAFCYHTERIFPYTTEGRKFTYMIPPQLINKSKLRLKCATDGEWWVYRNDDSPGQEIGAHHQFFSLGSLDDCIRQFFVHSGVDLSASGVLRKDMYKARPDIYDAAWADMAVEYFQLDKFTQLDCRILNSLRKPKVDNSEDW